MWDSRKCLMGWGFCGLLLVLNPVAVYAEEPAPRLPPPRLTPPKSSARPAKVTPKKPSKQVKSGKRAPAKPASDPKVLYLPPKVKPKPTAKSWRPPPNTVYVDASGIYPHAIRVRYGRPLRFIQPQDKTRMLALVAVDPHQLPSGNLRALSAFPSAMSADSKWTWLGDSQGLAHRHWAIGQAPMLNVQPETFLFLSDEINGRGVGYLWPLNLLFYVTTGSTWHKVIVTVVR